MFGKNKIDEKINVIFSCSSQHSSQINTNVNNTIKLILLVKKVKIVYAIYFVYCLRYLNFVSKYLIN